MGRKFVKNVDMGNYSGYNVSGGEADYAGNCNNMTK